MNASYAAVVLAGGLSTRMKQFKPLLPLGNSTITDFVINTFLNAGVDIYLVAGYHHDDIKNTVTKHHLTFVYNPDFEQGMFSSIKAGIRRLPTSCRSFFIIPVDIPLVRSATIKRLIAAAEATPQRIIYPVFGGKRGHPPLVPHHLAAAVLDWPGDGGLKAVLDLYNDISMEIPMADSNILFDIDTPENYSELLKRFQLYEIPTQAECEVILNDIYQVPEERIKHSRQVTAVAGLIAEGLIRSGKAVDAALVQAAALLHDIAKGQPKHDIVAGRLLHDLGFGKTGEIVSVHTDLAGGNLKLSLEAKIVYLADKFVSGDKRVTLEERYDARNRPWQPTPEALAAMTERYRVAQIVKAEMEKLLSRPLDDILKQ